MGWLAFHPGYCAAIIRPALDESLVGANRGGGTKAEG
jgi:hypothetical protein